MRQLDISPQDLDPDKVEDSLRVGEGDLSWDSPDEPVESTTGDRDPEWSEGISSSGSDSTANWSSEAS